MVLSSIVSGTDRLIILLKGSKGTCILGGFLNNKKNNKTTDKMLRSVSDLPQDNTVTYSLEELIFIGIHGQHMFTVRVLFQRGVDPVHESKPLLL